MGRFLAGFALAVAFATASHADDSRAPARVEAIVPVPPYEHERLHFFDGRRHHVVPGTVTIDRAPYECDLDRRRFTSEDDFVAHLRGTHHRPVQTIPDALVVRDGVVHFIGH